MFSKSSLVTIVALSLSVISANAAPSGASFGSCSTPQISFAAGLDGRKETAFVPTDLKSFNHGSADNIAVITGFICSQLPNACKANAAASSLCTQATTAANAAAAGTGAQADAFNKVFGVSTSFASTAVINNQGKVVSSGSSAASSASSSSSAASAAVSSAAASSAASSAGASAAASSGGSSAADAQTSLQLDPRVLATGFEQDGQANATAGQVPSATSSNNFINFCLLHPDKPITNGQQIKTGSCNPSPMGVIAATTNMPASKFQNPPNFGTIKSNTAFSIQLAINHIDTGHFVNAQANYYAAPQSINVAGDIIGHTHVVIEAITSFQQTTPTDPNTFAFFKGVNQAATNGILTVPVDAGLPAGFYRLASINAAANHQPVVVAVAQHGSLDDMVYFEVSDSGVASSTAGAAASSSAGSAASAGSTASTGSSAAASTGNNSSTGSKSTSGSNTGSGSGSSASSGSAAGAGAGAGAGAADASATCATPATVTVTVKASATAASTKASGNTTKQNSGGSKKSGRPRPQFGGN